jgi:hypothetical protein
MLVGRYWRVKRSKFAASPCGARRDDTARLWRDQGKRNEARDLLAPVYGWFTVPATALKLDFPCRASAGPSAPRLLSLTAIRDSPRGILEITIKMGGKHGYRSGYRHQ